MAGETYLSKLVKGMTLQFNNEKYVFCKIKDVNKINANHLLGEFKETEGTTVILDQSNVKKQCKF